MPSINPTRIISIWKKFQQIIKIAQIYSKFIKFSVLLISIILTILLEPFHIAELGSHGKEINNFSSSFFSFNPAFVIFTILTVFIIKQMLNLTLLQNTIIFYAISLRGLEILPLFYLYRYLCSDLLQFGVTSYSGFILYNILISLKFSNQVTIYIPKRFICQPRVRQIKTFLEYFLQILFLWKDVNTRYDSLIILNRLLIVMLYSNLYELLSNEDIWKKLISFTEFDQNDNTQTHRLTKDQLFTLFPSINVAYEILAIRSTMTYIIVYNIYQLIDYLVENSQLNNLFIQSIWFLIILLIVIDCFLSFYHTNIFGLFWFYIGLSQWNDITEIDIELNQSSNLYSIYLTAAHFIDKNCFKKLRNIFFSPVPDSNEDRSGFIMDPTTIPMLNQGNVEEDERNPVPPINRVVLDLYETNGTPRIHFVGDDINIQEDDILIGFVGISGRGKSQLLRCLTGNPVFKSGNRPTTYKAVGTLCTYNNRRYWIIDAPGDSQATEPEEIYYYKKWVGMNYDGTLNHRLKEENGHKYEEAKLTTDVVTKYNSALKQKLHLCIFVFDNRIDQLLKDYYNNEIIRHVGTRSRVVFARTKWDSTFINTAEERKNIEEAQRQLLIETFQLDANRVQIVFTTGLIDDEPGLNRQVIRNIRDEGFNINNLKQMIDETMNDHWENLQEEKDAIKQGFPLRLSELKEGDHILYFPTLKTKKPYSALIALNQNGNIQVYARTAKFINNQRQENSSGTEYHYFSFDDFRRLTFEEVGETVPDDYVQDPLLMIRQLYKNSTVAERDRTNAILKRHPEFETKICGSNSDGPSKTLARAESVLQNTNHNDDVVFKPETAADFVYSCKTGQQPPLDANFWITYNLSSISELTGYGARALSYFAHLSVDGAAKSICRAVGNYPIVEAGVCVVNCYQDPDNKGHYIAKAVGGAVVSTVVCVAAASLTGPFAPIVLCGGMVVGGEIGNFIGGKILKRKAPKNKRQIKFGGGNTD